MKIKVSKPGLRVYVGAGEARVLDGLGVPIISTSKGVLSNKKAKQLGVGGELLCEVTIIMSRVVKVLLLLKE